MGCDIHLHVEVKLAGDAIWHHYHQPYVPRDYDLFARMANVRNYSLQDGERIEPIAEPRGLPLGLSALTRFAYDDEGPDAHSASWLSSEEIAALSDWGETHLHAQDHRDGPWDMEREWRCYLFGNSFAGFHKYPQARPEGLDDVRFVFWFDN